MSEKPLRGAGPDRDQAGDLAAPATPAASSGGHAPDSGGTPIEPWGGERTERVSGREGSGARVALVPVVGADGQVDSHASTADTRRVADSGRTTLIGVPSPVADQGDKPTTSPGHDVHLPSEKTRVADSRPVAASPTVEIDPSSTGSGKSAPPGSERGAKSDQSDQPETAERKDNTSGEGTAPSDRTMAAAAATFRASMTSGDQPAAGQLGVTEPEQERSWTADRTQEFQLELPPATGGFAKALAAGMALALGTGILVVSFVHARVRGGTEVGEVAHSNPSLPVTPVPLPPSPLPENPLPTAEIAPTNAPTIGAPRPEGPEAPPAIGALEPSQAANGSAGELDEAKADRRAAQRGRMPTPAGRTAPSARTPRATTAAVRPGLMPFPSATPPVSAPAAAVPTAPPPLAPPQPEKPAARPEAPKTETAKPYDPDMPLPPSTE